MMRPFKNRIFSSVKLRAATPGSLRLTVEISDSDTRRNSWALVMHRDHLERIPFEAADGALESLEPFEFAAVQILDRRLDAHHSAAAPCRFARGRRRPAPVLQ